jgi:hypothetical protein
MKTIKQISIIVLLAIMVIAVIACKEDEPDPQPPPPPPQPTVTMGGKTIPVYKGAGVSDADFATTVENLKSGYSQWTLPH